MTPALLPRAPWLESLWTAGLLCEVCEEHPWQTPARWHTALVCAACAEGEPDPAREHQP